MTALAISLVEGDSIRVDALALGSRSVVGRGDDADIRIENPTVSREHCAIVTDAAGKPSQHRLVHLSRTNPTSLNGRAIREPAQITDRDTIGVGDVQLTFHDLAAGDRLSGPICHVCGRENETERDCWYCGASLLNAPTTLRQRRQVMARVIALSGPPADLYEQGALVLGEDGRVETVRNLSQGATGLVVDDGQVTLVRPPSGAGPEMTREPVGPAASIAVGQARFGFIARAAPGA
jgi:hypothetical protein